MSLAKQEFTNNGRTLLGNAQAGNDLHITKIVIGDGSATQPSDLWPLLQLIDKKMDVVISTKTDYGNGTMLVEGSILSTDAPSAFYLREVGVMAQVTSQGTPPIFGADSLYSVSNVFLDPPAYIDPAAPTVQVFKVKLIIDRIPTANVIVQIGPSENVTGANIGLATVGPGVFHDSAGNVLNFKRLVQGVNMDIHDSTDGNSIYIGTRTLQQNLDLYVPANNPDAGPSPPPNTVFATIQAAHDYLLQFTIPPQYHATIHVHELNHAVIQVTTPINISHPNASQINITGEPVVSVGITSITPGSGSDKVVHVTSAAGLAVGQFVAIVTSFWGYGGGCYIKSIAGLLVTCNTWDQGGMPVYNKTDNGASSPRLIRCPTVLQMATTPSVITGMINFPYGIGLVSNICAVGDPRKDAPGNNLINYLTYIWSAGGIGGGFINCMAMCGRRGFNLYAGSYGLGNDQPAYIGAIVASNCGFGITGSAVVTAFDRTYVNGNTHGILPSGAGYAIGSITGGMDNTIVYLNHNYYGVNCAGLFLGGSYVYANNQIAFWANGGGSITLDAAYPSVPEYTVPAPGVDTNGVDLKAIGHSFIFYDQWGQHVPVTSPPHDSVAPADLASGQLSYIHVQDSGHPLGGMIGPGGPVDGAGNPQGPQTPVTGPPGPDTPPGNIPWTPSGKPTVPPILSLPPANY